MNTQSPDRRDAVGKAFSVFIQQIEEGSFSQDLTEEVQKIVAALHDHIADRGSRKAAGRLTITLDFSLEDNVMEIKPDFSAKLPKTSRGKSVMFVTDDNWLSASNPRQRQLPLGPVAIKAPAVATAGESVDKDTGEISAAATA